MAAALQLNSRLFRSSSMAAAHMVSRGGRYISLRRPPGVNICLLSARSEAGLANLVLDDRCKFCNLTLHKSKENFFSVSVKI